MISPELKIAIGSWTDLDEGDLDAFSTTAASIVSDAENYPLVMPEAAALLANSNAYHLAYSRYKRFGGSESKDAKDFSKYDLYASHHSLAIKLEETANGSQEYLTRPGYRLDQMGGRRSTATVLPPMLRKVESKSTRGRVKFILRAQYPREVKAIIGRWSDDNGLTWHNGLSAYQLRFILDGQPSGKGMLYQFMFIATNSRESDWSERIYVDVF